MLETRANIESIKNSKDKKIKIKYSTSPNKKYEKTVLKLTDFEVKNDTPYIMYRRKNKIVEIPIEDNPSKAGEQCKY